VDSLSEKEVPAAKPFHMPDLFRIGMYKHVSLATAALRCHNVLKSTVKVVLFAGFSSLFVLCLFSFSPTNINAEKMWPLVHNKS